MCPRETQQTIADMEMAASRATADLPGLKALSLAWAEAKGQLSETIGLPDPTHMEVRLTPDDSGHLE